MKCLLPILCLLGVVAAPGNAAAKITDGRWEPSGGDVIRFDVLRQGKPFGFHQVAFQTDAKGRLIAHTNVNLRAGLGPVTLYSYRLEATEIWEDGQLVSLAGKVRDDGSKGSVSAQYSDGVLKVDGTEFEGRVPAGVLPASHWNREQTAASRLLSTEDGELLDVSVSEIGRETLSIAGQRVDTTRYLMDAAIDVHLWYDDAGRWVKLAFSARGQDIEYVLARPY